METTLPFVMPIAVILVVIGTLAASVFYMRKRRERARAIMSDAASACGLEYSDGRSDAQSMEAPGFLQGLLRDLIQQNAPWRLSGTRSGQRVEVYPETRSNGKSSTTYVIVQVCYTHPLSFEIRFAKEGIFTKLGKAMSLMKDVETGDPDFDPLIRVKTKDEASAQGFLSDLGHRQALVSLVQAYPEAWADKEKLHWERVADSLPAAELERVLSVLVPSAEALSR